MSPVNPGFSGCPLVPMACVSRMSHLTPHPASSPMELDALEKLMTMFFPLPSRFSNSHSIILEHCSLPLQKAPSFSLPRVYSGLSCSISSWDRRLLVGQTTSPRGAASPRGADVPWRGRLPTRVQLDALRSSRLSSCPLPLLHHSCPLQTHAQGSPDHVDCSNLAPRAEGRDAWLIASGLRDFKKTWASLRILESTKTGVRPRNTFLKGIKKRPVPALGACRYLSPLGVCAC